MVMVPNPVSGVVTVGMLHCMGPTPCVQLIGAVVVVVAIGKQICQNTFFAVEPVTAATNWAEVLSRIVMDVLVAPDVVVVTSTATGVLFPPHPTTSTTSPNSTPSPHALICLSPTMAPNFLFRMCG